MAQRYSAVRREDYLGLQPVPGAWWWASVFRSAFPSCQIEMPLQLSHNWLMAVSLFKNPEKLTSWCHLWQTFCLDSSFWQVLSNLQSGRFYSLTFIGSLLSREKNSFFKKNWRVQEKACNFNFPKMCLSCGPWSLLPFRGSYNRASIWAQPVQYANSISK